MLKDTLAYDPTVGKFTWKTRAALCVRPGYTAGCLNEQGYIQIRFKKKIYKVHRLVWLFEHGNWPKNNLDHLNGIRSDNRIQNLRECTAKTNCQNYERYRSGNLVGASYHKHVKRWVSRWAFDGKMFYLGYYDTEKEASDAYWQFDKEWNSGFVW